MERVTVAAADGAAMVEVRETCMSRLSVGGVTTLRDTSSGQAAGFPLQRKRGRGLLRAPSGRSSGGVDQPPVQATVVMSPAGPCL